MNLTNDQAKQYLHRIKLFLSSKGRLDMYEEFSQWFFIQPRTIKAMEMSFQETTGVSMDYYFIDFMREIFGRNDSRGKSKRERFEEYITIIQSERVNRSPEDEFNKKIDMEFLVEILDLEERVSILMTIHGYLQSEIGITLNKTESRVNQHLKNAVRKIKQYLKFREGSPTILLL